MCLLFFESLLIFWHAEMSHTNPCPFPAPGGLPFPSPMHACMLSRFSCVRLCATLWTAAHQAPLSTGFSRQEYWSGLPFPSPYYI